MVVLKAIIKPGLFVYYVENNKFTSKKEEAKKLTEKEAMNIQNEFIDFDLQMEEI